ncbi:hypothetical protein OKW96_19610 [Sphingobacterium sp. KU25419]|nr:hypothetical protein OKW96_19610 [Sphingobacterium sp. KU25419]
MDILQGLSLIELLELSTYQEDRQLAFRSAWIFETIVLKDKGLLDKNTSSLLIQNLSTLNNWSCARSYSKVLMYLTSSKATYMQLTEVEYEVITDVSFSWLINPSCPIAVLANCMDILDQLSVKYPWIREELDTQVEYLLRLNPTPAIKSRSLKILKKSKK